MFPLNCDFRVHLLILFVFSAFEKPLHAEPPSQVLDPLIITASHLPSTLDKTSASTTLITRKEIEARQAVSVVDFLRQVPGLHIDQPGGRGGVSSIYIRGSDPNFTVVMIDGVKVNDPTNSRGGSFDLSTLDPEMIERIEIVRGPLSSMHGSDAMGGLIHIVTRSGTAQPQTSVAVGGDTEEGYRAGIETRGPLGSANYALNLSYVNEGFPVEGSRFVGTNISGKLSLAPSNSTWLELASRYGDSEGKAFPDDSGGPKFAVLRAVDQREDSEWTVGAAYGHYLSGGFEYRVKTSYYLRQEEIVSPGVAPGLRDPVGIPPHRSDNRFDRTQLAINTIFSLSSFARLSLGAEAQFENGESRGSLSFGGPPLPTAFDLDREIYSVFGGAAFESAIGLTLEGGARLDASEGFDTKISPRAGLIYPISGTGTTLKANWGEGFKLPSFFALGNAFVGNAALFPETSRNFEIGILQSVIADRVTLQTTYFNTRFFNLIDLDEGPPPVLVNRSKVRGEGGELALGLQANSALWMRGHLTYTETEIVGSTEALRNRPEWRGGINARWQVKEAIVSTLNILYVGTSLDSSVATGDRTLEGYIRVDVSARWTFRPDWMLSMAIDNLFDTAYEEALGFPAPGLRGRIGLHLVI